MLKLIIMVMVMMERQCRARGFRKLKRLWDKWCGCCGIMSDVLRTEPT
jgi:hypothetical protein